MTYATHVVADALDAHITLLGSAGAKAMAVVGGDADVYVHAGGMYQWDSAAPAAVALAAGLHVSRIDGSPLVYNQPDPWLPDLLVCQPALADRVLGALGARNHQPAPGGPFDAFDDPTDRDRPPPRCDLATRPA